LKKIGVKKVILNLFGKFVVLVGGRCGPAQELVGSGPVSGSGLGQAEEATKQRPLTAAVVGVSKIPVNTVVDGELLFDDRDGPCAQRTDLVVQRSHYELARSGHPRFATGQAHWNHPALHYRLIDGDIELLPGLSLLETSGHTTGHQSVLVRLPEIGAVLLTIDAVMMQRLFTPDRRAWPMDENEEELRASTRKLLNLVKREQVKLVIFGHDGQQWQTLKKAPEYYE
jgi:N-acyl homoserine lactone hydrolase